MNCVFYLVLKCVADSSAWPRADKSPRDLASGGKTLANTSKAPRAETRA